MTTEAQPKTAQNWQDKVTPQIEKLAELLIKLEYLLKVFLKENPPDGVQSYKDWDPIIKLEYEPQGLSVHLLTKNGEEHEIQYILKFDADNSVEIITGDNLLEQLKWDEIQCRISNSKNQNKK